MKILEEYICLAIVNMIPFGFSQSGADIAIALDLKM